MNNNFNFDNFLEKFEKSCTKSFVKKFDKNETIYAYLVYRTQLCILIEGEADLIRYDRNGNKNIVDHFVKNSMFGEIFYNINNNSELFVIAKKKCKVLFFDYNYFNQKCKTKCPFHEELIEVLPNVILNKISDLNFRIELLAKRSTREKLLLYFNNLSIKNLNQTFYIPFSFTDLADYLSVDRSAMMREIKQLKDEEIIKKEGNRITLLTK